MMWEAAADEEMDMLMEPLPLRRREVALRVILGAMVLTAVGFLFYRLANFLISLFWQWYVQSQ